MRFAGKLTLLAVTTLTWIAFVASPAPATPVELDNEGQAAHCSISPSNCMVHVHGDMGLQLPNMQVVSVCTTEIDAGLDEVAPVSRTPRSPGPPASG